MIRQPNILQPVFDSLHLFSILFCGFHTKRYLHKINKHRCININIDEDDDDDKLFLWYGWPTKNV